LLNRRLGLLGNQSSPSNTPKLFQENRTIKSDEKRRFLADPLLQFAGVHRCIYTHPGLTVSRLPCKALRQSVGRVRVAVRELLPNDMAIRTGHEEEQHYIAPPIVGFVLRILESSSIQSLGLFFGLFLPQNS
jgi:hypothetical protein